MSTELRGYWIQKDLLMNMFCPFWKDTGYCPSVLFVTEDCRRVLYFKQWLEAEGCQVYTVNINNVTDLMALCRNTFFDLMMLNIEASELTRAKEMYQTLRSLYKNLGAAPALLTLPMVVMTTCDQVYTAIKRLALRPVYHIPQDASAKSTLLQTVEQIHYLNYRYM